MKRRIFLGSGPALLMAPRIGFGAENKVLRFVPQSDLGIFDPAFTTAHVTRNHAYLVYDTLFGTDDRFHVSPQMVAGHVTEDNGKTWNLTLRDGLRFHDGEPVLARDVVASIRRWWRHDAFGQELAAVTQELTVLSDKVVRFRLSHPCAFLPAALGQPSGHVPAIMPERLAEGPADRMVTEIVGSGPFRFKADEHEPGSRVVYERFGGYVPSAGGTPSLTAGPKVTHVDRVEWRIMFDPAAAATALAAGEVDWIETPLAGLLPVLRRNRDIEIRRIDKDGALPLMRFNHLHAPFDNPAIRRVVLRSINQADFLMAVAGEDRASWKDGIGVFAPGTALASDAGMEVLGSACDLARSRKELLAAGYKGEPVVILVPSDHPTLKPLAEAGAELLAGIGFNLDRQEADWGTLQQRRLSRDCVGQGGWSVYFTHVAGMEACSPASHQNTRGLGLRSTPGWPTSARLEELRAAWFAARDLAEQQAVARRLQEQVLTDLPYVPLGQFFEASAHRKSVSGILSGFPLFHNLRKA